MLNRIRLTNFQRHRALEVTFNAGISALRGSNEAGKSTLIRAICYALFGAKALPMSLAETVTWGEAESTLKVELELSVENVVYTIKRGKSGAEVTYDGGIVTGQNECTAFVSKLMKADAGSAAKLMLANQNEIRGALEKGAPETTKLIEQLAEFDQLDNLIELMQERLTLGSPATAEAAIVSAEAQLEQAQAEAVAPDLARYDAEIAARLEELAAADRAIFRLDAEIADLRTTADTLAEADRVRDAAMISVTDTLLRRDRAKKKLDDARGVEAPAPVDLDALRARLVDLGQMGVVRKARLELADLLGEPARARDERYEGTLPALHDEIALTRKQATVAARDRDASKSRADLAESKISTGSCSTCGQDISHLPEVAARNATLKAEVTTAREAQASMGKMYDGLTDYLKALEAILKESQPRVDAINRLGKYVKAADGLYPPTLEWIGGEIPDDVGAEASRIQSEITTFEKLQRAFDVASGQAEAAALELVATQADHDAAVARAQAMPYVDPKPARAALREAEGRRPELAAEQRTCQRNLDIEVNGKQAAIDGYERALRSIAQSKTILAARRTELKSLAFNNGLIKAVRAARPVIADRLWNLVLAAVGKYFSEMRGTNSRVTKDGDGFKVDGHTATTLSGSTLDILGLAIRVALTRTFLPSAPFLVLDEPAAAMDGERTELMLGFLVTCGFPQTLLVTHEDISESVADNIITI